MTITMTEKLARALAEEDSPGSLDRVSDSYRPVLMAHYVDLVRSVLLSLREPTEGMIAAIDGLVIADFISTIDHILHESGSTADPT